MKLPASLKVRFVRVILETGEVEILATSLTEEEFRSCEFKELDTSKNCRIYGEELRSRGIFSKNNGNG